MSSKCCRLARLVSLPILYVVLSIILAISLSRESVCVGLSSVLIGLLSQLPLFVLLIWPVHDPRLVGNLNCLKRSLLNVSAVGLSMNAGMLISGKCFGWTSSSVVPVMIVIPAIVLTLSLIGLSNCVLTRDGFHQDSHP